MRVIAGMVSKLPMPVIFRGTSKMGVVMGEFFLFSAFATAAGRNKLKIKCPIR